MTLVIANERQQHPIRRVSLGTKCTIDDTKTYNICLFFITDMDREVFVYRVLSVKAAFHC